MLADYFMQSQSMGNCRYYQEFDPHLIFVESFAPLGYKWYSEVRKSGATGVVTERDANSRKAVRDMQMTCQWQDPDAGTCKCVILHTLYATCD